MTRPAQILLVDDEASIQRAMAPLLRSRGYAVLVAGTGRDAIDLFERERPDLVILDLGLPDMDGSQVCRQLRERSETPIVVLTARGAEQDKIAAYNLNVAGYMLKTDMGTSFQRAIALIDNYWKVVEFPGPE